MVFVRAKGLNMLESQQSLSFSVAANPGVYALLLGSGVSGRLVSPQVGISCWICSAN